MRERLLGSPMSQLCHFRRRGRRSSGYSGVDAGDGACAVVFESELALHAVEGGLDLLADAAEYAEPGFLVFAVGSHQFGRFAFADLRTGVSRPSSVMTAASGPVHCRRRLLHPSHAAGSGASPSGVFVGVAAPLAL